MLACDIQFWNLSFFFPLIPLNKYSIFMPFTMIAIVLNNNWCVIKYLHLLLGASELVCALKCAVFSLFFLTENPCSHITSISLLCSSTLLLPFQILIKAHYPTPISSPVLRLLCSRIMGLHSGVRASWKPSVTTSVQPGAPWHKGILGGILHED